LVRLSRRRRASACSSWSSGSTWTVCPPRPRTFSCCCTGAPRCLSRRAGLT
jgi:hypothetical protein